MGRIITVSAFKGGVGKTTTSTNLAAAIKKNDGKKKVLLIDLDFQCNATMAYNYNPEKIEKSIYEAIHKEINIKDAILHHISGVDIIPAIFDLCAFDIDLYSEENKKLFPRHQIPYILRDLIEPLRKEYDYIICDAGPSLSMLATNYITMSDQFIVVLQTGRFALTGAIKLIEHIHTIKRAYAKGKEYYIDMVVTFFDNRTNISVDVLQEARKYADKNNIYISDIVVPKTIRYENAQAYHGVPLVLSENTEYSECYEKLARELIINE